ncbi:cell division protein FtsX [Cohnella faecalis]|uniref:Cell division protein FtsX n=1 Tax=Cohnella faecalis TaxID=2315694 RepID=A0A398CN57_9BACL|nr:permease-like cell division protein FtsX [Cohnella faecalis]RIE04043.1 ABC transporter permease [Cohnella faecalis]
MRSPISYYIRDACAGLRRNAGAAAAACALVFAATAIFGTLLIVRSGTGALMNYLESQITIKLYVEPSRDARELSDILVRQPYVKSASVETKEQLLERFGLFFQDKRHLLESLQGSDIPDAVTLELTDPSKTALVAGELQTLDGIATVIYPQKYAAALYKGADALAKYGFALFVFFAAIAFINVLLSIHLSLQQRKREIRVKLLLGARPLLVRGQFLFEGSVVALAGSLLAALAVYTAHVRVLIPLDRRLSGVIGLTTPELCAILAAMTLGGTLIGLTAAYLSTRKLISNA